MSVSVLNDRVLAVLVAADGKPLKAKDVSRALDLSSDDRGSIRQALFDLVDDGRATQLEGRRFVAAGKGDKNNGAIKGSVQRKASGVGWFIPDDKNRKDAFIPPAELRDVIDGDIVMAKIERSPRGPVAMIVEVVSHTRTTITGTLQTTHDRRAGTIRFIEVDDNLLSGPVKIEAGDERCDDGDVVEVELISPPTETKNAVGKVVRRIGKKGALDVEIERLVTLSGVVRAFPPDVLADAGRLGDNPGDDEIRGRLDLRQLPIVTIDGETAKDFDDAVYAVRRGQAIDVTVCVADVSHYVREGEPLDREARSRATSIYYPGRVIPMLPEALSNGLCSLRPRVPRLCAVCTFTVDVNGGVGNEQLAFGVMQSRARLTYSLVQRFLDEEAGVAEPYALPKQPNEATTSTADLDEETKESLRTLADAATRLRAARNGRGALDFELPELIVELDEHKEPTGLRHLNRAFSHKLIEDLMIAANEASARYFDEQHFPSIYRIHEQPDEEKLSRFLELARPAYLESTGATLPKAVMEDPTSSTSLMALMHGIGEHPSRQALDMLLLRSMKQARYSVDNVGHYGLGSSAYLHFTSPIRRYPDLVVHRLLRQRLEAAKGRKTRAVDEAFEDNLVAELEDIALSSSERERKASDLERAITQLHACWLMKDRVGEIHAATVTGVSEAGAFVRLTELYVDGLVRIDALGREYYSFDADKLTLRGERSAEIIGIGTTFDVEVADVDLSRRQIAFVRVPEEQQRAPVAKKGPPATRVVEKIEPPPVRRAPSSSKRPPPGPAPARKRPVPPRVEPAADAPWQPRTDAVAGPPKKAEPKKAPKKAATSTAASTRGIEVEGRHRSRQQRIDDDLAYESARRAVAENRATDADKAIVERRKAEARQRREAQKERTLQRKAVRSEQDDRRDDRSRRYDEQQQRPTHRKLFDEETMEQHRSTVRGPDDLRRLFTQVGPLREKTTPPRATPSAWDSRPAYEAPEPPAKRPTTTSTKATKPAEVPYEPPSPPAPLKQSTSTRPTAKKAPAQTPAKATNTKKEAPPTPKTTKATKTPAAKAPTTTTKKKPAAKAPTTAK
ncbi:MAG TPA: ribonuclease R, partial [Myxococcota bacterium]